MTDPYAEYDAAQDRIPPPEHEVQVLGAMLTSTAAIDDVAELITEADFSWPRHGLIFDTILRLSAEGKPTDALAVGDALAGDLSHAGGRAYLAEITQALVTAASAAWHAGHVKDDALRRTVRAVGATLQAISDDDPLEMANEARGRIDALIEERDQPEDNFAAVFAAIESLDAPLGVKTPWLPLSNAISGWAPGMLYVAGARPGIGKTVMGIGALLDIARRGHTGVMFSMEMPKTELYLRMLSTVGHVDGENILHRNLDNGEHARMRDAAHKIAGLPLVVDDRSHLSLAQIRAKVRTTQRKADVGLVVVDYLSLVRPPGDAPRNDRRVQVDAIAQGLKNLARDAQVPILALAQLNRGIEGRAVKKPTMADLRESGGIEAAADCVLLMHRDIDQTPDRLDVEMPKNRHGPLSSFHLTFDGRYSQITEPAWQERRTA